MQSSTKCILLVQAFPTQYENKNQRDAGVLNKGAFIEKNVQDFSGVMDVEYYGVSHYSKSFMFLGENS